MQHTLKTDIAIAGTGLHSGRPARLTLRAAEPGYGIWFRRTDIRGRAAMIPAAWDHVVDTRMNTRLGSPDGLTVLTVEHLMAALAGTGVTNALIEIDGPEVPVLDGSSVRYVREILSAGLLAQDAPQEVYRVTEAVRVGDADAWAELSPHDGFEIDFAIDFPGTVIGAQAHRLDMANGAFVRELADCRTFVRRADVEGLQRMGLALGGSLDNAVVVDGHTVLSPGGFRRADECVRHKMLDALGDLFLAGAPILGRYRGHKAGHGLNNRVLRAAFAAGALRREAARPADLARLPGRGARLDDLRRTA